MAPAMVVMTAITIASRGRSTNIADNMMLVSIHYARRRRPNRDTGAHNRQAIDNDQLTTRQALLDHYAAIDLVSWLHPFDGSLAVLRREHVDAFLVCNKCGLGDHNLLFWFSVFEFNVDELPIYECSVGVRERGARENGVSATIDLDVDEIDGAF